MGGTGEARQLARIASGERGFDVISALAGRVRAPALPEGAVRIGGFGGAEGLRDWLLGNTIDVLVDATHPFAAAMSHNAAAAARAAGVPMVRLSRPGWTEQTGDHWQRVADLPAAATATAALGGRVFLTIGRQGVAAFADLDQQWFLIRSIDPPQTSLPPRHELLLARGPFTLEGEMRLLRERGIDVLVTKDSGAQDVAAKLAAARALSVPVVMIDRPAPPSDVDTVASVSESMAWLQERSAAGR